MKTIVNSPASKPSRFIGHRQYLKLLPIIFHSLISYECIARGCWHLRIEAHKTQVLGNGSVTETSQWPLLCVETQWFRALTVSAAACPEPRRVPGSQRPARSACGTQGSALPAAADEWTAATHAPRARLSRDGGTQAPRTRSTPFAEPDGARKPPICVPSPFQITESHNGWSWKGPLWVTESNPPKHRCALLPLPADRKNITLLFRSAREPFPNLLLHVCRVSYVEIVRLE